MADDLELTEEFRKGLAFAEATHRQNDADQQKLVTLLRAQLATTREAALAEAAQAAEKPTPPSMMSAQYRGGYLNGQEDAVAAIRALMTRDTEVIRNLPSTRSGDTEVTPEMIEAGTEAISRRWGEFTALSGYRLMDEVIREVFLAMSAARR